MPISEKISDLILWFEEKRRPFPWRELAREDPPFAYYIWVSEVMLQQTRAEVVVPYFKAWMKRYPTVESLAQAPIDGVIKTWEGLGYYSRARRLWLGAKYLVEKHCGRLPDDYEELLKIPGFGPYTAGAVVSFAFRKKAAAVDGNVIRVCARLFAIDQPVEQISVQKRIWKMVWDLLPEERSWVVMEALIELGATLCSKKPKCDHCPLRSVCVAHGKGAAERLPVRSKRVKVERLHRDVALVTCNGKMLVGKVEAGKVMADLYEFPYCEKGKIEEWISQEMRIVGRMDGVKCVFTRFQAILYPYLIRCERDIVLPGYKWVSMEDLRSLAFSSGHRNLLGRLFCHSPFLSTQS